MENKNDEKKPLRVLHVEDSTRDAEIIRERLADFGRSIHIDWASNEQEFTAFLKRGVYDIVLADYKIPGFDILSALMQVKSFSPGMPFICVSGTIGEENAVELLRQGATDYVLKDRLAKLPLAMKRALDEAGERRTHQLVEETLRESEKKYRGLVDNANEVILVAQDDRIKFANRRAVELLGYSELEFTARPFVEFIHPDDRLKVAANYMKRIKGESAMSRYTFRALAAGGGVFWLEISAVLIDWEGKPATLNLLTDVTERKRTEDALRESERKYRLLVENLNEGIWYIDKESRTTFANQCMAGMLGYAVEEMTGKHLFEFMDARGVELAKVNLERRQKGIREQHEFEFMRKDGGRVIVSLETTPIIDGNGQYAGAVAGVQDITERKRAEETHLKYEQRLQQIQKLESLGLLAGGIAHDFNNLMSGIFGNIDLARSKCRDENITRYLSKALNSLERARDLTAQLLTFAKGGAPIRNVGSLVPFIRDAAQFALSGSNVSCGFDLPENLWPCNFDKNQIGQVIDNIIINAQQAMPIGGSIALTAQNITYGEKEHLILGKGDYVRISIKDDGIGIPEELLPRIFDPFYTTKEKGHGLGLATCYSIVQRHGGCIDVESEPGKGSTFHVYLPASVESVVSSAKKPVAGHKGSGTFLLMDDEEAVREVVGEMLDSLGYTVVYRENGRGAVDFFLSESEAGRQISGMIFDFTIPGGMGGLEAVAEIRKSDQKTPVFVTSGYAKDTVMANPTEYGFTASICKPFSLNELTAMLNEYLHTRA